MRYIRRHSQQNLIEEDSNASNANLITERLRPETFDNVKMFKIQTTQESEFFFQEGDNHQISDIIEGHAQFTFVRKDGKAAMAVRYDWVVAFEFELF